MTEILKYKRPTSEKGNSRVFYGLLLLYAISTTIAIVLLVNSVESLVIDPKTDKKPETLKANLDVDVSSTGVLHPTSSTLGVDNEKQQIYIFKPHNKAPYTYRASVLISKNLLSADQEINLVNELIRQTGIHSRLSTPMLKPVRSIFRKQDSLVVDLHSEMLPLIDGRGLIHLQNTYTLVHSLLEYSQLRKLVILFGGGRKLTVNSPIDFLHGLQMNYNLIVEAKS